MNFEFRKSTRKNKKYMAKVGNKWVHFGQLGYEHYYDATPLHLYSNLNHLDPRRRRNFKARHEATRHKKYSPSWFSDNFLWS